jgi:cell wall assembly regulator SMI1
MGLELPEEVRASYRIHDGTYRRGACLKLFGWNYLMPLDSVVRSLATLREIGEHMRDFVRENPSGPMKADYWNPRWVPLMKDEESNYTCIDLDPAQGGFVGQVIDCTRYEGNRVLAQSWGDWLSGLADGLEAGKYRLCVPYDWLAVVLGASEPDRWEPDG